MSSLLKNVFAPAAVCVLIFGCHHHTPEATNPQADAREKLFQRFVKQLDADVQGFVTNRDAAFTNSMRRLFDQVVIDPSFGLEWDEVPGPTMQNSNDMASIESFIKVNGWNMETNRLLFDSSLEPVNIKPISGLPWKVIQKREFPATTENGILFVLFNGWHHNSSGVAYNPDTNAFPSSLAGFKPIGAHWYVWVLPEDPIELTKKYEGTKP
jgi:hypothetical protein